MEQGIWLKGLNSKEGCNGMRFRTLILAILLIITFFITSAHFATFVLGRLSSNGNPNPKNFVKKDQ
ncbi:BCCT family transporter [Clostridium thermarum]|uniref:BCCT family transporter n=1 Tax=Clostridium thermarum TaxID=1716543 RepID=UPI001A9ABC83